MPEPEKPANAPFIVTAELPPNLFAWANDLRRAHFPPERNWLVAHVTLFHAFAPSLREELLGMLGEIAAQAAPPPARLEGMLNLGGGTALAIRSPAMLAIRAQIAERFHGALTKQDSHTPRLHITIQNKVTSATANELQKDLARTLEPVDFAFAGLGLHLYRNPHWDNLKVWKFRGDKRG